MRLPIIAVVLSVFILMTVGTGCQNVQQPVVYSAPDYMTRDSLRNSVVLLPAQPLLHSGKALAVGNYLYINERYKGWHIIDNSSAGAPRNVAFLSVPGSVDGDLNKNYLYTNNANDLVIVDVSDPLLPFAASREEQVLNTLPSPHDPLPYYSEYAIVGWHDSIALDNRYYYY